MKDPGANHIKAWAKDYDEKPFSFVEAAEHGKRLIAWSENEDQIKKAFYGLLDSFPTEVEVLLKISLKTDSNEKPLWTRYHGQIDRWKLFKIVSENECYVFSDGMHQFCIKDKDSGRYLAFDEHGIFYLYGPSAEDIKFFEQLGFENRYAEPIFSIHHFQHVPKDPEKLEMKIVADLGLTRANSDLD